ncbi:MAG: hypothetical protein KAR42_16725 [candidate division Zixibacteria bacterium]|nr:hypothetical protein [candidate division Zixibacteria bacterium]
MEKTRFVWLADSCHARNGRKLIKDQTYEIADFDPAVVETWVKTKAARYSTAKSKEEEKS